MKTMSPLALVMFFVWGVIPLGFVALLAWDALVRRRRVGDDLEACWRLPAREPGRTQKW